MGLFDGAGDAPLFDRGRFLPSGFKGVLEVKRTIAKESVKSGVGFICEFEVISVERPGDPENELSPVREGEKRSWWQGMTDKTVAFPSLKAWAGAVAGYAPHEKEAIEEAIGGATLGDMLNEATEHPAENDFVGAWVGCETHMIQTKKGNDFTVHNWFPYVEDGTE